MRVAERITQRFLERCSNERDEIRALLQAAGSRSPALLALPCQGLMQCFLHTLAAYLHATRNSIARVDAVYTVMAIAAFTGRPSRLENWTADQKVAHLLSIGEGLIHAPLPVPQLPPLLKERSRNLKQLAARLERPLQADLAQVCLHFAQGLLHVDGSMSLREQLFFDEISAVLSPEPNAGSRARVRTTMLMPDLFGTREPVKIYFAAVKPGDLVQTGDPCFYSYSGTEPVPIPAPGPGRVQALLVDAGELVPVGTPIAELSRE